MIEKIMVVAPTTAVPISTGFAVALKVLPAPSFSSRFSLARSKFDVKPNFFLISSLIRGSVSISESSIDRLRVIRHRSIGIDRDR